MIGIPFDRPVVGYGGKTINTLRLWAAAAPDYFDFQEFSSGDFVGALAETLDGRIADAGAVSRRLHRAWGRDCASCRSIFWSPARWPISCGASGASNADWSALPDKVAIQLNDTHPTLAVPELMRILLDDAHLGWDEAVGPDADGLWPTRITRCCPKRSKNGRSRWFEHACCRGIWRSSSRSIAASSMTSGRRCPGDEGRVSRVSLIEEGAERKSPHGQPGDRRLAQHQRRRRDSFASCCARRRSKIWPRCFPSVSTTRPTASRRAVGCCWRTRRFARTITEAIGDGWMTDLGQLSKLTPLADDAAFRDAFRKAKREAKARFADWLKATSGQTVDPDTIFDCQIKRIHEYKRQLLNALRIVVLYNRLRENPNLEMPPRTFFFAGKAAPAYHLAKLIIKFINNLAGTIDGDPVMRGRLKVVFLPDYCVSLAERLIPASDVSNQISTAGYEASGTSNMKFMMNGALTIGTRDGATIEMARGSRRGEFLPVRPDARNRWPTAAAGTARTGITTTSRRPARRWT